MTIPAATTPGLIRVWKTSNMLHLNATLWIESLLEKVQEFDVLEERYQIIRPDRRVVSSKGPI